MKDLVIDSINKLEDVYNNAISRKKNEHDIER